MKQKKQGKKSQSSRFAHRMKALLGQSETFIICMEKSHNDMLWPEVRNQ